MSTKLRGFTLVELLVVIAIIGVLVALLLPAVQAAREAARRSQCSNNFKQTSLALLSWESAKKRLPPGVVYNSNWPASSLCGTQPPTVAPNKVGNYYRDYGWAALILPFLEEGNIADRYNYDATPFDMGGIVGNRNYDVSATPIKTYQCPSNVQSGELVDCCGGTSLTVTHGTHPDEDVQHTSIVAVSDTADHLCTFPIDKRYGPTGATGLVNQTYANGAFGGFEGGRLKDFTDGLTKTFFVGEVVGKGLGTFKGHYWASRNLLDVAGGINGPKTAIGGKYPDDVTPDYGWRGTGFASYHPGGCHFAMGDGSVRFISEEIAQTTLDSLTTRAGAENSVE